VCAALQVPFLQAELHSSLPTRDPAARLQHVQAASEGYCAYLQRCQQYGLLRGPLADAYSAEEAGSSVDPGTVRNQRIERFKRSKAVSGLLQQMRGRRKLADEEVGCLQGASCSRIRCLRACLQRFSSWDLTYASRALAGR
jgi:hypothetical protein